MTVLVTGDKGMIGSHLVKALLSEGYKVVGIDRTGEDKKEGNYTHYQINLEDDVKLKDIVDREHVDRIIHLAALAHTEGEKDLSFEKYKHVNVDCAKNVFNTAEDRPLLFISTIDVYGFYDGKQPVNGNSKINPISNYGKSKALAEDECMKLKNYSIYRFSPVYTDDIKRDIQKRYYLKYPTVAYKIGKGSEYEILNINKATNEMVGWCAKSPQNDVMIIKDDKSMWTTEYIKEEKKQGRARIVLWFPRSMVKLGYSFLKKVLGENEKTYLLNKAVYPLRSE